jgi:arylformamidase
MLGVPRGVLLRLHAVAFQAGFRGFETRLPLHFRFRAGTTRGLLGARGLTGSGEVAATLCRATEFMSGSRHTFGTGARQVLGGRFVRRFVDLSHVIEHGMTTYPGLPAPVISIHLSYEASRAHYATGTEFQIGRIEMVANTGTYVDAPAHRFAGQADLAGMALERLADLPICLVRPSLRDGDRAIGPSVFDSLELKGCAMLVQTGWATRWGTDAYLRDSPFLTAEAASLLAERGSALVGIDSLNIDDTQDGRRPAHTALLGAGIPIVEHLCGLDSLPAVGGRFFAVPVMIKGMATFPVRAFAIVD